MNRLHPFSAVTYSLRYAFLGLWLPLFLVGALAGVFEPIQGSWTAVAAPLGFLLGLSYGVAYYYRFGYQITEDTVDVASGVFARRSREIPYGRIQNVDIRQGVVQRLLGVAVVSIETAGGGETEATLSVVGEDEADRLQAEIRRRTASVKDRRQERDQDRDLAPESDADVDPGSQPDAESGRPPAAEPDGPAGADAESDAVAPDSSPDTGQSPTESTARPSPQQRRQRLFELADSELLLYAFTTFRPAAGAAGLFLFFFATDAVLEAFLAAAAPFGGPQDLASGDAGSYGILTIVSGLISVGVTYLLSVAYTFAMYYGFELGRIGDDFVYDRGLLQRYSGSIPAEKVQSVTVTDNPLQRLLGYAGLWVETAGYGPDSDAGSQSAVPLAARDRIYTFTENLTGVETPSFESPSPIARRRYLVRYSLIAAVIVAVAFGVSYATPLERWYLAAVVFVAVPPAAHLRYKHLGYFVGDDHLVIRSGFWRRRTTVIPYYRIQTVSTRRSIFQRRLGLASLVVDTASSRSFVWSSSTIYDVALEDARDVHGTSRDHLQTALRERKAADDLGVSVDFT
ncbi:PH domain-containing protein [Halopiger aswanensis]|nr:PH domain-containing protein [Halopiger aswanensis]